MDIFLIRHGETVWNRERRVQGRLDSPLTARGVAQAQTYGRRLARLFAEEGHGVGDGGFAFVSSPLGRAWQTAVLLAHELGVDPSSIDRDPLLSEMTWGDWDGLTAAEIEARDAELWAARIADRWTVAPPGGGETQSDIIRRAGAWFASLPDSPRLVIVAHGALGRAIRTVHAGEPSERMLELDEPQDAFFRLRANGAIERIDC